MHLKKGRTKAGRGKSAIGWLGDSFLCMMDREVGTRMSWPILDGPHKLMRGHIQFTGVAQYILARW